MSETKKILSQVKKVIDSSLTDLTDPLLEAIVGQNFQSQMEHEKNKHVCKYLESNSEVERELKRVNDLILASMKLFEKKLAHQNMKDLQKAVCEVLRHQMAESHSMQALHSEIRMMISDPHSFIQSTLRLEEETLRMENELSQIVSLPFFSEFSFSSSEDFPLLSSAAPAAKSSTVLKIQGERSARDSMCPEKPEDNRQDVTDLPRLTLTIPIEPTEPDSLSKSQETVIPCDVPTPANLRDEPSLILKPVQPESKREDAMPKAKVSQAKLMRLTC